MSKTKRTRINGDGGEVILKDTGEIIEEDPNVIKRSIIIEDTIPDDPNEPQIFNKGEEFVKLYDEVVPQLKKQLTTTEIIFVLELSPHVSYKDCIIRKTGQTNSTILTAQTIAKELEMDYGKVRRLIGSLKKKGVIAQCETGNIIPEYYGKAKRSYLVNPYIYFRGVKINPTVKAIFEESGWASYSESNN